MDEYKKYVQGKIKWCEQKYKKILNKNLHENQLDRRVQEIYRDLKVIQRKIQLIEKEHIGVEIPEESLEEIASLIKTFKEGNIAGFETFLEFYKK
jgi:hypothetical protein